jgi:DNA-binding protein HU-beta
MAKALSKSQIVALVAEKSGLSKKQTTEILNFIAALAYKNAKDTFTLPGLGKLVLVNRKARIGRNPATGETIQIKAKRVVKFRVAKAAKKRRQSFLTAFWFRKRNDPASYLELPLAVCASFAVSCCNS